MEENFLSIFESYSLEILIIALGAFFLTFFIKMPIKNLTANLCEEKRKMVNIVIVFIPLPFSLPKQPSILVSKIKFGLELQFWTTPSRLGFYPFRFMQLLQEFG